MRHLVGFGRGFLIHSKSDMISYRSARSQTHRPAACSWKLRVRVAVTAAVRLCLFAVTLQWSTQLSAVCLTAERHTVTLVRNEIISLPPIRCHPHRPPNSTLWWIPIKCSSPSAVRRSAPPSTPFKNALKHYNHTSLEHFRKLYLYKSVMHSSKMFTKTLLQSIAIISTTVHFLLAASGARSTLLSFGVALPTLTFIHNDKVWAHQYTTSLTVVCGLNSTPPVDRA